MVLAWEDPPRYRNRTLAALAERPGAWAHIGTAHSAQRADERARALVKAARAEGAKVETLITRLPEHGHVRIFARLVAE